MDQISADFTSLFLFKQLILSPHIYCSSQQFNVFVGDKFYVGLNGLELLDNCFVPIPLCEEQLQATPWADINSLPEILLRGGDARCLANLINSTNDTFDDRHMWLSPLSAKGPNTIYLLMDEPVSIGCIKICKMSSFANCFESVCVCMRALDFLQLVLSLKYSCGGN